MTNKNVADDNAKPTQTLEGRNRRIFIKKASAGVVLTSLPAQSVWGAKCTVSGAMSGNHSQNHSHDDCDTPVIYGRSPGWWKEIYLETMDNVHGPFNNVDPTPGSAGPNHPNAIKRDCYIAKIHSVINNNTMGLHPDLYSGNEADLNIAIQSQGNQIGSTQGSLEFNLAAVWLNSYFGFYSDGNDNNTAAADDKVNEILAYFSMPGNDNDNAVDQVFNWDHSDNRDSTTDYVASGC